MLFDAPDEVLGIVKFTERVDGGCWGGGISVYGDSVSVLRTACRCCGGTAAAMHVSVLRTACLRCGGHSRSDACVSLRTACLHCGGHSLSDACVSLWTACLRCGGHSHSDECVSSADSVSPLWWPQPQ